MNADTIQFSRRGKEITVWAAVVLAVLLLYSVRHLLGPFVWAVIATYIAHPVVTNMERGTGVHRAVWILLIYIAFFAGLTWVTMSLGPILKTQALQIAHDLPAALVELERFIHNNRLLRGLGITVDLATLQAEVDRRANDAAGLAQRLALPVLSSVIESAVRIFVFLMTTFYLLLDSDRMVTNFLRLFPPGYRPEINDLLGRINRSLGAYLRSQVVLFALMSVVTFIFLSALDMRYALILAIMTGALELIPIIGPYVAGGSAIAVSFFQEPTPFGWSHVTLAIVIATGYFVLRQLEDNLVIPMLVGRAVHLNPIIVIFTVTAGASLGGLLGLIIAVPVASAIRIVGQYLFSKLMTPESPVVLELDDTEDPVESIRQAAGSGVRRLVVVTSAENAFMDQEATYRQIQRIVAQQNIEVTLVSASAAASSLAEAHGLRLSLRGA